MKTHCNIRCERCLVFVEISTPDERIASRFRETFNKVPNGVGVELWNTSNNEQTHHILDENYSEYVEYLLTTIDAYMVVWQKYIEFLKTVKKNNDNKLPFEKTIITPPDLRYYF